MSVFSSCLPLPFELYAFSKRSIYPWIYYFRVGRTPLFLSNINPCLTILRNIFFQLFYFIFCYDYIIFVFICYFVIVIQLYLFHFLRLCNRLCLPPGSWPGWSPEPGVSTHFKGKKIGWKLLLLSITLWQILCQWFRKEAVEYSVLVAGQQESNSALQKETEPSLCLSVTQSYLMNYWGYCWVWLHMACAQNFLVPCEHLFFGISRGEDEV